MKLRGFVAVDYIFNVDIGGKRNTMEPRVHCHLTVNVVNVYFTGNGSRCARKHLFYKTCVFAMFCATAVK